MIQKLAYVLVALALFLAGAAGGVWSQTSLIPYLVSRPAFQNLQIVKDWNAKTLIMRPVQEIRIDSAQGPAFRIAKVRQSVVGIESASPDGGLVRGTGLVATSDGLVLTICHLAPKGDEDRVSFSGEAEPVLASVLKRDFQKNLALLKVERDKLQTVNFTDEQNIALGTQIFLLAAAPDKDGIVLSYQQGALSSVGKNKILATFAGSYAMQGGAVFDERAQALGIAYVGEDGKLNIISSPVIRAFLGL
ncbi:MAG: trypsin-like peptidase domain-containing protein [Candidatus Wildermuthbacteria bacterium]|nr:trypsin-like peptidase domain-containing protein [Candidatus Wildermuthbacteria bacterium]